MLFLNIHAETCLSFYFEVLYSWNESFFQGIEIQEKGVGSALLNRKTLSLPLQMRTAGFVRQEEWLEFFFFFFPSFDFILFSILAVVWYFKPLEAHGKYSFMREKILFVSLLSPVPPQILPLLVVIYALLWVVTV